MCSNLQDQVSTQLMPATVGKMTGIQINSNKPVLDLRCICIFPLGVELAFGAGFGFG